MDKMHFCLRCKYYVDELRIECSGQGHTFACMCMNPKSFENSTREEEFVGRIFRVGEIFTCDAIRSDEEACGINADWYEERGQE